MELKQPYLKRKRAATLLIIAVLGTGFLIDSCRKNNNSDTQAIINNPAITQAKTWYENAYPVTGIAKSGLTDQSTKAAVSNSFDFSQYIKPDWQHAANYTRLGKNVVETPFDPGIKFGSDLKNALGGKLYSGQKYSRSYFLLLNDSTGYHAYIMMIIADSAYINNNLNKLADNSYRKHDPDFSGMLLYFTPKGVFVNGYSYKKGSLAGSLSNRVANNPVASKLSTNELAAPPSCTDWYLDSYVGDELISSEYVGTTCDGGDDSGGGDAGGGDDDGGFAPPAGNDSSTPYFGNGTNAIVPDNNFDNLLNYVESTGNTFSDPYPGQCTDPNGVTVNGEYTDIIDADGNVTVSYFSPDETAGYFTVGNEYAIGNNPQTDSQTTVGPFTSPILIDPIFNSTGAPTIIVSGGGSSSPCNTPVGDAAIKAHKAINKVAPGSGGGTTPAPTPAPAPCQPVTPKPVKMTILVENPNEVDWADEPDNEVLTDPNPITYAQYQQTTPWPTIPNIIPFDKFVPFRLRSPGVEENCLVLSKEQIAVVGYTCSGYLPGTQTFQTYTTSGVNLTVTKQAITYIISALSNKIPVIAGVDAYPGSPNPPPKGDGITDHFITIDGMGTDANGKYFHFVDNSTVDPSAVGGGDVYYNKLYYNPTTGIITGKCNTTYTSQIPGGHDYIVTQIRKSIKK